MVRHQSTILTQYYVTNSIRRIGSIWLQNSYSLNHVLNLKCGPNSKI